MEIDAMSVFHIDEFDLLAEFKSIRPSLSEERLGHLSTLHPEQTRKI
jgi:hypothetical protein